MAFSPRLRIRQNFAALLLSSPFLNSSESATVLFCISVLHVYPGVEKMRPSLYSKDVKFVR